jgi:hypothetical protein
MNKTKQVSDRAMMRCFELQQRHDRHCMRFHCLNFRLPSVRPSVRPREPAPRAICGVIIASLIGGWNHENGPQDVTHPPQDLRAFVLYQPLLSYCKDAAIVPFVFVLECNDCDGISVP